jgi:hypothetical protein
MNAAQKARLAALQATCPHRSWTYMSNEAGAVYFHCLDCHFTHASAPASQYMEF